MDIQLCGKSNYLKLCNGNKILIWKRSKDGTIIFSDQFKKLWFMLAFTGTIVNKGGGIGTNIPKPIALTSFLKGNSFLSDPTSIVRVVSFVLSDTDGPIITDGIVLETYSDAPNFLISWKITGKHKTHNNSNVRIGFYTSDIFQFQLTNNLYLICGNRGPSLFDANNTNCYRGSFECQSIPRFYVAVDKEVNVKLKVTAIIPKKRKFPIVTYEMPYTKYINISNCKDIRTLIPVYTLTVPDPNSINIIKAPVKKFVQISRLIQRYLDLTSLTITLFQEQQRFKLLNMNNKKFGVNQAVRTEVYENVPVIITQTAFDKYFNASLSSQNIPVRTDWDIVYQGIKLFPDATTAAIKIDYKFSTLVRFNTEFPPGPINIRLRVTAQWMDYFRFWHYHTMVNETLAITEFPPFSSQTTVQGSFMLKPDALDFNLTVYYISDQNNFLIQDIVTMFESIVVTYLTS